MFKKVKNWPVSPKRSLGGQLSIMIAAVSFLSLLVIQQVVMAAWQDPTTRPGEGNVVGIVLNPITENIDLNGFTIADPSVGEIGSRKTGVIEVDAPCCRTAVAGVYVESDNSEGYGIWANHLQGFTAAYFQGKVGIGQADHPAHLLDIVSLAVDNNAEINIQSGVDNNYWAIYHDGLSGENSNELRFWSETLDDNVLSLDNNGNVEINNGYLKIDSAATAPLATDCNSADEVGRMILDYVANKLYICSGSPLASWKSTTLAVPKL